MSAAIATLFGVRRALIGMLHVPALPGTPNARQSIPELIECMVREAQLYREAGFHGLILENMHDRPYLKGAVGPEIVAALTVVGREVRRATDLPLGIQVLAAANQAALAVAHGCGASFVRVEGFVFAHVADEGLIEASAGALLRYRRHIGAESVRIFADIKKKHSAHAITADVPLEDTALAAEFFLADGVIVTGTATGVAANPDEVASVKRHVSLPVLVGSGVTPDNLEQYAAADGLIVGSWVKRGGVWSAPLERERVFAIARAFQNKAGGA